MNRRSGYSLIELLVVISIVALILGLLLPTVHKVRESVNRSSCQNNLKQVGLALLDHEAQHRVFPTGGEGVEFGRSVMTTYDLQSTWIVLLPYLDQENIFKGITPHRYYRDPALVDPTPYKTAIRTLVCPSNPTPGGTTGKDAEGYGICDYMPIVGTDIHPTMGFRWRSSGSLSNARTEGVLRSTGVELYGAAAGWSKWVVNRPSMGSTMASILDGFSNTLILAEDVGRGFFGAHVGRFPDPYGNPIYFARWAEPDQGNLVSGPPVDKKGRECDSNRSTGFTDNRCDRDRQVINNNFYNRDSWTIMNYGPNEEIFSFHTGGAFGVFADGHVGFLKDTLRPTQVRAMITPSGGEILSDD